MNWYDEFILEAYNETQSRIKRFETSGSENSDEKLDFSTEPHLEFTTAWNGLNLDQGRNTSSKDLKLTDELGGSIPPRAAKIIKYDRYKRWNSLSRIW